MSNPSRARIALVFGGTSSEHKISLRSARAVLDNLDQLRFDVKLCGIDKSGAWHDSENSLVLLEGRPLTGEGGIPSLPINIDCVFPVLHGPGGEDGALQGWLELSGIPCVGSGTLGSAVAMDKSICKRILRDAGIEVVSWSEVNKCDFELDPNSIADAVIEKRGLPCFVKPAAQGSSIGISRVEDKDGLIAAMTLAFKYGEWLLVEPALDARELELAVLAGVDEVYSTPGEIVSESWYDFDTKYENDSAELLVPAEGLQPLMIEGMQDTARRACKVLRLSGMVRIDFFLGKKTGRLAVNEINTIPGFTSISMYPRLMAHAGIEFPELCTRLINEAINRPKMTEAPRPVEPSEQREQTLTRSAGS